MSKLRIVTARAPKGAKRGFQPPVSLVPLAALFARLSKGFLIEQVSAWGMRSRGADKVEILESKIPGRRLWQKNEGSSRGRWVCGVRRGFESPSLLEKSAAEGGPKMGERETARKNYSRASRLKGLLTQAVTSVESLDV